MKRITLFAGHYGSGKTNVALNWARHIRRLSAAEAAPREVVVADLDIVNPYFRTKDSAAELAKEGIGLVVSEYANSNVDFPALPREIYALTAPSARSDAARLPLVVMDIGGDDRGALALGRYVDAIRAEDDYDMLAVVNAARPLTRTAAETLDVLREIEAASALPFTGVVNNTNLGPDTTVADVLASETYADDVARRLGVSVRFTSVRADLADAVRAVRPAWTVLPLAIQRLYYQLLPGSDGRGRDETRQSLV